MLNINDYVIVRLTEFGRKKLKEQYDESCRKYGNSLPYDPPVEDKDGWSRWQLWDLMEKLGRYWRMGNRDNPFELYIGIDEHQCKLF